MAKKKVVPKNAKRARKAPPKMGLRRITKIFGWPGEVKLGKRRKMATYP